MPSGVSAPTEVDVITRAPGDLEIPKDDAQLAEQMRKQEFDLLRGGLERAGIKPETIQKLVVLDGLGSNAGKFLVGALDLSHKMMIYSNISLMEQADWIKKNYLENAALEDEYKIEWQKCYNEIADLIGKGYERTLAGTQAMAKIMEGQSGGGEGGAKEGKKKPGFTPLRAPKSVNAPKN